MAKALLFNWHGVLDHNTFEKFIRRSYRLFGQSHDEFPNPQTVELLENRRLGDLGKQYHRGAIQPSDFWGLIHGHFSQSGIKGQYMDDIDPNEFVWNQMRDFAERYRLGLVSDMPEDKAEKVMSEIRRQKKKRGLEDKVLFDPVVFSHLEGRLVVEENQKTLYKVAAERMGLAPEECIVIDDSVPNAYHAAQEGFSIVSYRPPELIMVKTPSSKGLYTSRLS